MVYLFYTRTKNIFKIIFGFVLSYIFRKPFAIGLPLSVSIEPVSYCNLHCPECPTGNGSLNREKKLMSFTLFSNIINEIKVHTFYLTLYFQGEPFIHPHFADFVKLARQNHIYTATSTNAQLINNEVAEQTVRSGLNKLIISVDGTTQETYEKYRVGGQLDKATQAIKHLVEWKKKLHSNTPKLEIQFLVLKHNEHQIPDIKKLAKELGVNKLSLKTAQIYDFENGSGLIPAQEKYARYIKGADGLYERKKKIHNRCRRAFSATVISVDGEILPCSFDKKGEHCFGNIKDRSFSEIWHNEKASLFRRQILMDRKQFDMCRNCTE
ncbi:MAG: radical SAM protein [Paludibacteraceae bacterium]|nr:radical SAM protein [Paludibacteraceae bacterium]